MSNSFQNMMIMTLHRSRLEGHLTTLDCSEGVTLLSESFNGLVLRLELLVDQLF